MDKKTAAKETKSIEEESKKNLLRESEEAKGTAIRGYNFDNGKDYDKIMQSLASTGFQASNLDRAIRIINKMIDEKAFIYLGYTSNMVSSGLRDVIRYLMQNKRIEVAVTTAGGIEEDIIKCIGDFFLGEFTAAGKELRKKGINRIGNILASNNRYVEFEKFFQPILEELYQEQKKTGKATSPTDIIWKMGEKIDSKDSIYYWAWRNKIKVYCPAILDGAIGDNVYFFKFKRPDFAIDITEDIRWFNDTAFGKDKTGAIILGSGVVKHSILNTNMLRNGTDYAVYINNSQEFDGSDAGAMPDEAVSWGKILPDAESIKVFGDATLLFPLIVARTFAD